MESDQHEVSAQVFLGGLEVGAGTSSLCGLSRKRVSLLVVRLPHMKMVLLAVLLMTT